MWPCVWDCFFYLISTNTATKTHTHGLDNFLLNKKSIVCVKYRGVSKRDPIIGTYLTAFYLENHLLIQQTNA